ncbi:MAG TPA: hypothetical protein VED46_18730 [Alphaproteobacteria bacterium]|nr:hypothetical protein [Alphaproteobacteria bacterium]
MTQDDLMHGVQTGQTIWHEAHAVPGRQGDAIVLALFTGNIEYASGDTASYAGFDVIHTGGATERFTGTMTVLLEDGSVSTQTFEGEETFKEGPNRVGGTGTWKIVDGTGRFAELRGGGPLKWSVDGDKWHAEFSG